MFCFEFDAAFVFVSERTQADAWKVILCPVMKTVNPGEVAFSDQLRFGRQPVLHVVPGLRTLVDIIEVCPSGHFVRRWHKTNWALVQVHSRG